MNNLTTDIDTYKTLTAKRSAIGKTIIPIIVPSILFID
jgi:hypothetical protein